MNLLLKILYQSIFTDINTKVRKERLLQNLICLVKFGGNIMIKKLDLKIIKTLVSYIKLPKGYLNKISHFNNLMGEQENTVGKKWAYFGEFLEREPGYTTEKAIVYCYVCPFLTPVDINDYQVKDFAKVLQDKISYIGKDIVFVIGGAYGFSQAVYERADSKISLSRMTFSHQMVRAIFVEQIYRAFTIMRGEPYHHE